jgi:hypothetical protein
MFLLLFSSLKFQANQLYFQLTCMYRIQNVLIDYKASYSPSLHSMNDQKNLCLETRVNDNERGEPPAWGFGCPLISKIYS